MTCYPTLLAAATSLALAGAAGAEGCDHIIFSDVGWTDITSTTAASTLILDALGYDTEIKVLSIPVTYAGMGQGEVDIFLGNWMPTTAADIAPYEEAGTVEVVRANLEGAKYTLGTNGPGAELGISSYENIHDFGDALDHVIYGIEAGNDGNRLIMQMIDENAFDLGDFNIVESSEQGMLAQVERKTEDGEPVVFLAWEPHPMNTRFNITYLPGGDDFFGPDLGGATIYTNIRAGFAEECPNIGKFLENLVFTLEMENEIMNSILGDGADPHDAARAWLAAHPDTWQAWLTDVTTKDGGDAVAAVAGALD